MRAVAYLAGGGSTEDLVLVNSPGFNQKLDVQFVELYTSVVDNRGRPVDGLAKGDFKVFEDGRKSRSGASSGSPTCRSTPASCSTPRRR